MTGAVVARPVHPIGWEGRAVNEGGEPQHLGRWLHQQAHQTPAHLLALALIDEHPEGFEYLSSCSTVDEAHTVCWCHGPDSDGGDNLISDESDALRQGDWLYVLASDGLHVYRADSRTEEGPNDARMVFTARVPWSCTDFPWDALTPPAQLSEGELMLARLFPEDGELTPAQEATLMDLLDQARSLSGVPLHAQTRARITAAAQIPCRLTWEDARSVIVNGTTTLWQAVVALDARYSQTWPQGPEAPPSELVLRALREAVTART